jgi:hypothetical protein
MLEKEKLRTFRLSIDDCDELDPVNVIVSIVLFKGTISIVKHSRILAKIFFNISLPPILRLYFG